MPTVILLLAFVLLVCSALASPTTRACDSATRLAIAKAGLQDAVTFNVPALETYPVTTNATLGFSIDGSPPLYSPPSDVVFHQAAVLFSSVYIASDNPTFTDDPSTSTVTINSLSHYGIRPNTTVFTAHVTSLLSFTSGCLVYNNLNELTDITPA